MARDFTRLDALLQRLAAEGRVPGCGCCIMQGDEILYEGYAGCADLEQGRAVTADSIFRQASTTKLFTYAILGMLYEEGHFLFSDPIAEYLPEWKHAKKFVTLPNGGVEAVPLERPITIRDAVAMMCGMPYCMSPTDHPSSPTQAAMSAQIGKLLERGVPTLREEVRAMSSAPVQFEPGTHWQYGFGSEITGALVETFTGKHVREVFDERIIEPLDLRHTGTYITGENRRNVVTAYFRGEDGSLTPAPADFDRGNDPAVTPVGARPNLLSSPRDFAVFMQMLANGGTYRGRRFLGEGTVAMLHENLLGDEQLRDFTNDYLAGYGYGLGFRTLLTQRYGHNGHLGCFGWTGGFGTWAEADPVTGTAITYMHNMMPNDELYVHHRVRSVAYGCLL